MDIKNPQNTQSTEKVESRSNSSSQNYITNSYTYKWSEVKIDNSNNCYEINPKVKEYEFRTLKKVPKTGLMLVGLGGNNGTTVLGGLIANKQKISWYTKKGEQRPNFYGSLTQCSTTKIGVMDGKEIYLPLNQILPMVDPSNLIIGGWDINKLNMSDAMRRAEVFEYDLQIKLSPLMKDIIPLPGIYYKDFIASNQEDRADHILPGDNKQIHLETIRKNISDFKEKNSLDKVIILWSANTERMAEILPGVNTTEADLLAAIEKSHQEISPSTIYAVAAILEGCSFINGSPQNTLVPGVVALAETKGVFVVGNDFKSGQTKFKTAFTEFLVQAGIKPKSIVSYNHLGNNDGKNLNEEQQFKSKEKSKSSCVDDILYSNTTLFQSSENLHEKQNINGKFCDGNEDLAKFKFIDDVNSDFDYKPNKKNLNSKQLKNEHAIDHCVVIKYVPSAGDTKKAMDEYTSEIFMGGQHIFTCYNVCEDSLLAAPLILDLVLLTELFERIEAKSESSSQFNKFHTVLDLLGYLLKAPMIEEGYNVVNSLSRQRNQIENILKVCAGIPLETNLTLERRVKEGKKKKYILGQVGMKIH